MAASYTEAVMAVSHGPVKVQRTFVDHGSDVSRYVLFFFSSIASREILNGEFFHIFGKLCFFSYFYHPQKVFKFIVNMKPL